METSFVNGTIVNTVPGVKIRVPKSEEGIQIKWMDFKFRVTGSVYPLDTLDTSFVLNQLSHEFHNMISELEKNGLICIFQK